MDAERWARIERLFREAAAVPAAERGGHLDRACAGDAALRRELDDLLRLDAEDDRAFAGAVDAAAHAAIGTDPTPSIPERIGPYRLERELGAGGMGTVYLGIRDDDAFSKQVAIKLLRPGPGRHDLLQRFRGERQILATLEHPNIARLLDGGSTDAGEPYVVMEYVDGRPLLEACDAAGLSTRQRVELFCKICEAVEHAHEHAIVHRDIKPSNVLVGASGEPKLLDFGIAKLLDPGALAVNTAETATSMRMMTPQYASPEQVRGEPATVATDVYALGVLLYELLTGRLPYRVDPHDLRAIEREVCERDPPRPSRTVARGDAAQRVAEAHGGVTPTRLRRTISGDLDNIVLTALRKKPSRRYPTARALADDLRRHLAGLPVQARPATPGYRFGKFVRRRPTLAVLVATLLVTLPALGLLGARAVRQHRVERQARVASLLGEARWLEERRRDAEVLGRADAVLRLVPDQAEGLRHRALARYRLSREATEPAQKSVLGRGAADDTARLVAVVPDAAWSWSVRAYVLDGLGRHDEARRAEAEAQRRSGGEPSDDDLTFGARLALARGERGRALEMLDTLIARRPDRAQAIALRAWIFAAAGDAERAYLEYRLALGIDPTQDLTRVDMARIDVARGALDAAAEHLERSLELNPRSPFAWETRGHLLHEQGIRAAAAGDPAAALRLFAASREASEHALELEPGLRWAALNRAASFAESGRLSSDDKTALLEQAAAGYRRSLAGWSSAPAAGEGRDLFFAAQVNYCDALIQLDRLDAALATCRGVTELFPDEPLPYYNLAGVHALAGRDAAALAALERGFERGDDDWEYLSRDAWFERLRDDPEFRDLLDRMRRRARG